jgi:hypothetical protein
MGWLKGKEEDEEGVSEGKRMTNGQEEASKSSEEFWGSERKMSK